MVGFKVITYDVEHGSCHALITPTEQLLMIDAGSREGFSPALHLKNNWDRSNLRWLTITHHDEDHLTDISNIDEHLPPMTLDKPTLAHDELVNLYPQGFSTPLEIFLVFAQRYNILVPDLGDPTYATEWGGVQFATFKNQYSDFQNPNINNLSIVTFARYMGWTFIFPGDLQRDGWLKLLEKEVFRDWLSRTDIFVASHHGRESGFCPEVFEYCKPKLTLISDKSTTETSCVDKYYQVTDGLNIPDVLGNPVKRYVLTTRSDGAIYIGIDDEGNHEVKIGSYKNNTS